MTPDTIYAKSAKGIQEIETRAHKLGSRLRQALIRIDGVKTMEELTGDGGELADAFVAHVEELEKTGFITDITAAEEPATITAVTRPVPEPASEPAPRASAPEPGPKSEPMPRAAAPAPKPAAPKPAAPPPEAVEFNSPVKFKLQDLLVDALGMETGKAGVALGNCRNRDDLLRWVDLVVGPIEAAAGRAKAKTFYKSAKKLVGG